MRCLIVLGYETDGNMNYEEVEGSPPLSSDDTLSPTNNSWSKEFEVPDGTPDEIIIWAGRGHAFMDDWTAQDTSTRYYKWVDNQWKEI